MTDLWHGMNAITLENEALRVVVLPELGAKFVSLYNKHTHHEWLIQPRSQSVGPVVYGEPFTKFALFGWDEMFPTITACKYPASGPYFGRIMPDHGEVWALPWRYAVADKSLRLSVEGRELLYHLERSDTLDGSTLTLDYTLKNTGPEPLVWLWAAHPQFTVTPGTELVLPESVKTVVNILDGTALGPRHERLTWPVTSGAPIALNRIGPASLHTYRKFYVAPELRPDWALLRKQETGDWLRMAWNPEITPYLGIWMDEGAVNPESTIAMEVSNGYYDSLAEAWDRGMVSTLQPGDTIRWKVTIALGSAGSPE